MKDFNSSSFAKTCVLNSEKFGFYEDLSRRMERDFRSMSRIASQMNELSSRNFALRRKFSENRCLALEFKPLNRFVSGASLPVLTQNPPIESVEPFTVHNAEFLENYRKNLELSIRKQNREKLTKFIIVDVHGEESLYKIKSFFDKLNMRFYTYRVSESNKGEFLRSIKDIATNFHLKSIVLENELDEVQAIIEKLSSDPSEVVFPIVLYNPEYENVRRIGFVY